MHPIELDALLKPAKSHHHFARLGQPQALYAKALKADPACAEALHYVGLSLLHRGRPDQALDLVTRSLTLDPQNPGYHNNLATIFGRLGRAPGQYPYASTQNTADDPEIIAYST